MAGDFGKAFEYKVIYIFTIPDDAHKGLIKIGDATLSTDKSIDKLAPNSHDLNQAAKDRIKQYTNTAGVDFNLLHTELAVKTVTDNEGNKVLKAFRDYDVQRVLENSNIRKELIGQTTGKEWFRIDVVTVKKAIEAVKNGINNLSGEDVSTFTPIVFRPEQEMAISQTVKQFKKGNRMLWNAKMRFGKTVCALEVARRMKFDHTIIITHRPVVNEGWYDDFSKIFYGVDCIYGSKANGYTIEQLLEMGDMQFVYFASIQDLRGSSLVGGKFEKNSKVFDLDWDFVIVDEAHEGTTTALGDDVIKNVVKEDSDHPTKFLALSGTPFNILSDYDEHEVYTWDYIMEQDNKHRWLIEHFGDSNPYEELPELKIYTYDLGKLTDYRYMALEDRAFNFHEFFRTWTGDIGKDYEPIPSHAKVGDFVHEADVNNFLNMMTMEDEDSLYPYSREEYRKLFTHSLWMLPGVREARALSKLMKKHPVFGSGAFNIVNVAGAGDEEESYDSALSKVQTAIKNTLPGNYTITLSCGKLTTGVTVREWTAVFMLAGSFSTSAANYLQTIFRVQSPCNKNGMIKEAGYVFDFAPDRTLKMVADAVSVSHKAGKTGDTIALGKFLNFCPVISVQGSEMKQYNTNNLLQKLKRAYADRVVRSGFDDANLYNDELLKLTDVEIKMFDELKGIIGKTKASPKANDITVNDQGLTQEEYEEIEKLKRKKQKELSSEEKARIEELKKINKLRNDAISILRGISIRMPLLIYGADIPFDDEVTIENFAKLVDDVSWKEFMPVGVTKKRFDDFKKYYDPDVFIAAGRRIRNIAKSADELEPTERVKKIASLFSFFKNPDKETVLTPWRVVNMHMSDCLGGYDFCDESHEDVVDEPRFVDQGDVTKDVFGKEDTHILEINSKTGLYPLYVTYSVYRMKCNKLREEELTLEKRQEIWDEVVRNNVFVICKTKMAKTITNRTLMGFRDSLNVNTKFTEGLVNTMKNEGVKFVKRTLRPSYWNMKGKAMRFDAIVGNPPYQEEGLSTRKAPIYHYFYDATFELSETVTLITPGRFLFDAGQTPKQWNAKMLSDEHFKVVKYYNDSRDIFPTVEIKGGIAITLRDSNKNFGEISIFAPYEELNSIVRKVKAVCNESERLDSIVASQGLFKFSEQFFCEHPEAKKYIGEGTGKKIVSSVMEKLPNIFHEEVDDSSHYIKMLGRINGKREYRYIERKYIIDNDYIDSYKLFIPEANNSGQFGETLTEPENGFPGEGSSDTFLSGGKCSSEDEVNNFAKYFRTKFFRALLGVKKATQHCPPGVWKMIPIQNFKASSDINWNVPIPEIDKQLYSKYELSKEEIAFIEAKVEPMV